MGVNSSMKKSYQQKMMKSASYHSSTTFMTEEKNNRNDREISQRAKREKKTIHILPFSYSKSCFYNHVVLHTKSFSAELIIRFLPLFRLPLFSSPFAMCPMGPMSFICSLPAPFITFLPPWKSTLSSRLK